MGGFERGESKGTAVSGSVSFVATPTLDLPLSCGAVYCVDRVMIRTVSLAVVLALTGPSAGMLVCELVLCAGSHHRAAAGPEDCHESSSTDAGPSWSATPEACHDVTAGIEAVVPAGAPLAVLSPLPSVYLAAPPPSLAIDRRVLRQARAGPSALLLATVQLRI